MEHPIDGIFFIVLLFAVLLFNSLMVRRFYFFFKNYLYEINEFIYSNNFVLIEVRNPNQTDWLENPFRTRNSIFIELVLPFSLLVHYTFIVQNSNKNFEQYWLRTSCSFVKKVRIEIRKADTLNLLLQNGKSVESNVRIVTDKCPGCAQKIKSGNTECVSCGLVFM